MSFGKKVHSAPDPWALEVDELDGIEGLLYELEGVSKDLPLTSKPSASSLGGQLTSSIVPPSAASRYEALPGALTQSQDKGIPPPDELDDEYLPQPTKNARAGAGVEIKPKGKSRAKNGKPKRSAASARPLLDDDDDDDPMSPPLEIVYDAPLKSPASLWAGGGVSLPAPLRPPALSPSTGPAAVRHQRVELPWGAPSAAKPLSDWAADAQPASPQQAAAARSASNSPAVPSPRGALTEKSPAEGSAALDIASWRDVPRERVEASKRRLPDLSAMEEGILDIPALAAEREPRDKAPTEALTSMRSVEIGRRSVERKRSCWPWQKKQKLEVGAADPKSPSAKGAVTEALSARKDAAMKAYDAKKAKLKQAYDTQRETAVGGMLIEAAGNVNPMASKKAVGSFESAVQLLTADGPRTDRFVAVKAAFDAEAQREVDVETVLLFAAASDTSLGESLKKAEVMRSLVRRKAWKWRPFSMSGVLATQVLLCLGALAAYRNPLNPPLAALILLFVVAAAASNKYVSVKAQKEKFDRLKQRGIVKYGKFVFYAFVFLCLPVMLVVLLFNVLFDLLVGRIKDYTYGATAKHLVSSFVSCTALSIGMRSSSPLDAVQTFAGFAFISQMDEVLLYKMSFDPYSDYFPVKEKEAETKIKVAGAVLSILVPAYAIVAFMVTISEYFCVICVVTGFLKSYLL